MFFVHCNECVLLLLFLRVLFARRRRRVVRLFIIIHNDYKIGGDGGGVGCRPCNVRIIVVSVPPPTARPTVKLYN